MQLGCVDALLSHVGPEALDSHGTRSRQTALHRACEGTPSRPQFSLDGPRAAIVMKLLEYNADANIPRVTDGATPLYIASEKSYQGVVRVLLGATGLRDVNAANQTGETALWIAARKNHRDTAVLLLTAKAEIDQADTQGMTPLHQAARNNNLDFLKLLLRRKADMEIRSSLKLTPLMVGARRDAAQAVAYLLQAKANHHRRDPKSRTALEIAKRHGCLGVVRVFKALHNELEQRGAEYFGMESESEGMPPSADDREPMVAPRSESDEDPTPCSGPHDPDSPASDSEDSQEFRPTPLAAVEEEPEIIDKRVRRTSSRRVLAPRGSRLKLTLIPATRVRTNPGPTVITVQRPRPSQGRIKARRIVPGAGKS